MIWVTVHNVENLVLFSLSRVLQILHLCITLFRDLRTDSSFCILKYVFGEARIDVHSNLICSSAG